LKSLFHVVTAFDKAGLYKPNFVLHVRSPFVIMVMFGKFAYFSKKLFLEFTLVRKVRSYGKWMPDGRV